MNFDFSKDQKLLQETARDYLENQSPLAVARQVLESSAPFHSRLWRGVAEMGWLGTAVPEEYGGTGFGYLELAMLAEEVGRALAPIPFSSSVYLAIEALLLAGSPQQKRWYLPSLASGELIGTLAIAEGPGQAGPDRIRATFRDGRLNGTKIPVPDGDVANLAIVAARSVSDEICLVVAELDAAGVTRRPIESIDPTRTQASLTFENVPAELLGSPGDGWALTEKILDRAAVLMAFEQLGGAQRAFDVTREYTMGRYAFGRAIASFQAIKHRMADMYVAIELARSNSYFGAWALSSAAEQLGVAACSARVSATEAFDLAAREMIQLHGGVGFTWEFDCHLFYRRSKLLALALGGPGEWREKLIQRLSYESVC